MITAIRTARHMLIGVGVVIVVGLLGLGALTHLATTFVIRGGSMEPSLPLGSLVVDSPASPATIRVGDVITIRADNGVLITHRVVRVVSLAGDRFFEIKGDANQHPDPVLIPARAVVGRVTADLPKVGYLAAMLGTPLGLISLVALLAAGMLLVWLAEEYEQEWAEQKPTRGAVAERSRGGVVT